MLGDFYIYLGVQQIADRFSDENLPDFLSSSGGPVPHVILFPNPLPAISTDNFIEPKRSARNFTTFVTSFSISGSGVYISLPVLPVR